MKTAFKSILSFSIALALVITSLSLGVFANGTGEIYETVEAGASTYEIQSVLNLNQDTEEHLTVTFEAGEYYLNSSLYVNANTTIIATGATFVKQRVYGALLEARITDDQGGYNGCSNITVDGGVWDSTPTVDHPTGTETFRFIHSNNITIKNAVFSNVPNGSHLLVFSGVKDAVVDNCEFFGYHTTGRTVSAKEALQIETAHDVELTPTFQDICWDDLPCDNITVSNCNFHDFSRGVGGHTSIAGKFHTNIKITDNSFKDMTDSAIRLFNFKDSEVSGNTIEASVEGILIYTGMEKMPSGEGYYQPLDGQVGELPDNYNIGIYENTIKNISDQKGTLGDGIRIMGLKARPLYGVKIVSNTITATGRYGIFVTDAPNTEICDNDLSNAKAHNLLLGLQSNNSLISGNTVTAEGSNKGYSGIRLSASDYVTVIGNTVTEANGDGIYLLNSQNCVIGTKVAPNTVDSPAAKGIYMTYSASITPVTGSNGNTVSYNKIISAPSDGIGAYKSSKLTINNNTVSAKGYGITLNTSCTSSRITGNIINYPGKNGINIYKSTSCIIGSSTNKNKIYYPKAKGIYISTSDKANISYNQISKSKSDSIGIYNSKSVTVSKNLMSSSAVAISVGTNSTSAKISGNTINSAASHGIYVVVGCKKSTISGNTIKAYSTAKKNSNAIYVSSSGGTSTKYRTVIDGNTITGSGKGTEKHAIKIYKSPYTLIQKNTVKTPAGCGIYASSSTYITLYKNKITSPKSIGIKITSSCTSAKVTTNTVYKPISVGISVYASQKAYITLNSITVSKSYKGIMVGSSSYSKITSNTIKGTTKTRAIYIYSSKKCTNSKNKIK